MGTFINDGYFVTQVRSHSTELKNIDVKLNQNLLDLKRTDCSIVFAGEFLIICFKLIFSNTILRSVYFVWHALYIMSTRVYHIFHFPNLLTNWQEMFVTDNNTNVTFTLFDFYWIISFLSILKYGIFLSQI